MHLYKCDLSRQNEPSENFTVRLFNGGIHFTPWKKSWSTTRFAVIEVFDKGLRFVHNPTKSTKRSQNQNCLEITKVSSFCTFGRVMYKTKTVVNFVDNRKYYCSLFSASVDNHVPSHFEVISRRF